MEALSWPDFERDAARYDAAVAASPEIDHFCTSSPWILAAHEAWSRGLDPFLRRAADRHVVLEWGGARRTLSPPENAWGFACPLVGPQATDLLLEACASAPWRMLVLCGVPPESELLRELVLRPPGPLRIARVLRRWRASLAGGIAGYLSRRSPHLRRRLGETQRRVAREGIRFERAADAIDPLLARILSVEARSWKGPARTGLLDPEMERFYRALARRLLARGELRCLFARKGGEDVGYILGGVGDGLYRGLQFSFDAALGRLSLGHALQLAQIEALCAEGIERYDLGMDMEYKRRWAEEPFDTLTLLAVNPAPRPAPREPPPARS